MIQSVSMICQIHVSMSSCPESNLILQFRMATIFQRTIFEQMKIFATTQTTRSTCWKELAAPGCSWLTPTEETTGRWAPSKLLSRIPTKWPNP